MPFTPFHWSVLILGFLFFNLLYLPALLISSVLMDVEPLYNLIYLVIHPSEQIILHGFFHTYLGATIVALIVGFVVSKKKQEFDKLMQLFKIKQETSEKKFYLSSFVGAYSHIFMDSFMHADMKPLWPIESNPFLGMVGVVEVYFFNMLLIGLGIVLYLLKTRRS